MASTLWNRSRSRSYLPILLWLLFAGVIAVPVVAQAEVGILPPVFLYNDDPTLDTEPIRNVILRELGRQLSQDQVDYIVLGNNVSVENAAVELVIVPEVGIAEERLYLSLTIKDGTTAATVAGAAAQSALDVGFFNQVARLYRQVSPRILSNRGLETDGSMEDEDGEEETSTPTLVAGLRFVGPQDGVLIRQPDGRLLGVTEDGEAVADYVVLGGRERLPLVLESRGFYSKEFTVELGPDRRGQAVELPSLDRASRVATYVAWSPQQVTGLALGGRYYLQPDLSFLQLEGHFHLQKDFTVEAAGSSSHLDGRIAGGRYVVFDYLSWFRASLEAAFGLIYTSFPGRDLDAYIDPYLVPLALSLEANGSNLSVFARFEARFALSGARGVFPRGIIEVPGQDLPVIATIGVLSKW